MIRRRCDWPGAEAKFAARDVDEERGDGALLGSDGPAYPLAIAQGELGKFILASPHANLVVVSMGNTWGADASCPVDIRPGTGDLGRGRGFRPRRVRGGGVSTRARRSASVKIPEDPFASYAREDDTTCRRRLSERSSRTPRETPRRGSRSRRGSPRWGRRRFTSPFGREADRPGAPIESVRANRIRTGEASSAASWTRWRRFARSGASWAPR